MIISKNFAATGSFAICCGKFWWVWYVPLFLLYGDSHIAV